MIVKVKNFRKLNAPLDPKNIQNFLYSTCYIESLDACMEY
jgi:hypothetical protein